MLLGLWRDWGTEHMWSAEWLLITLHNNPEQWFCSREKQKTQLYQRTQWNTVSYPNEGHEDGFLVIMSLCSWDGSQQMQKHVLILFIFIANEIIEDCVLICCMQLLDSTQPYAWCNGSLNNVTLDLAQLYFRLRIMHNFPTIHKHQLNQRYDIIESKKKRFLRWSCSSHQSLWLPLLPSCGWSLYSQWCLCFKLCLFICVHVRVCGTKPLFVFPQSMFRAS